VLRPPHISVHACAAGREGRVWIVHRQLQLRAGYSKTPDNICQPSQSSQTCATELLLVVTRLLGKPPMAPLGPRLIASGGLDASHRIPSEACELPNQLWVACSGHQLMQRFISQSCTL
jgi:hypothetical protein